MFITLLSFAFVGILFAIASLLLDRVWIYYVPCSLIVLIIWLKIIQASWNNNVDSLVMSTSKMEPSAAGGYASIISVVYGIFSIFTGNWIALSICIVAFIFSLTLNFHSK